MWPVDAARISGQVEARSPRDLAVLFGIATTVALSESSVERCQNDQPGLGPRGWILRAFVLSVSSATRDSRHRFRYGRC